MNKFFLTLPILIYPTWLLAHGSTNDGFLHPITGLDHLLAMLAVGAWSALIGGRAIFIVPTAFIITMVVGAWLGFLQIMLPYSELGIAISIIAVLFSLIQVPNLEVGHHGDEADISLEEKPLWRQSHFIWAVIAQFFNVAAQAGTWSCFINYWDDLMGLSDDQAAN